MVAQPVTSGMGMSLLQKMGWKPGEGLGKNHEGTLEPLSLPVKMDKRGLITAEEMKRPARCPPPRPPAKRRLPRDIPDPAITNMSNNASKSSPEGGNEEWMCLGKHPVSMLIEYCTKRHLNPPSFSVCFESGPSHKRIFLFKVEVNGLEYRAPAPSPNKKQAKSEAAMVCLKALGVVPNSETFGGMSANETFGGMSANETFGGMSANETFGGMSANETYGAMSTPEPFGMSGSETFGALPPEPLGMMPPPESICLPPPM